MPDNYCCTFLNVPPLDLNIFMTNNEYSGDIVVNIGICNYYLFYIL